MSLRAKWHRFCNLSGCTYQWFKMVKHNEAIKTAMSSQWYVITKKSLQVWLFTCRSVYWKLVWIENLVVSEIEWQHTHKITLTTPTLWLMTTIVYTLVWVGLVWFCHIRISDHWSVWRYGVKTIHMYPSIIEKIAVTDKCNLSSFVTLLTLYLSWSNINNMQFYAQKGSMQVRGIFYIML